MEKTAFNSFSADVVLPAVVGAVLLNGVVDQIFPDQNDIEHPSGFAASYEVRNVSSTLSVVPLLPNFLDAA